MERSPFLPLPEGMLIGQVEIAPTQLTVEVISTQTCAPCPGCGTLSDAVHCQYQRTVHDVPCGGRKVVLRLKVREFVCRSASCPRKVFAERLPELVQPWARVSNRLLEELKAIGLAASAEVSERLAPRLGMQVKAPTLLRYVRSIAPAPETAVRAVGIDDFAIKRGDSYGTILVNLETGKPLDLLPDRTADAVLPWLKHHQEIEVVSRDRASAYADAVQRALPHATQVADRYHLVQNLREHLQRFLDRKRSWLPEVEDIPLNGGSTGAKALEASLEEQAGPGTSPGSTGSAPAESTSLVPTQDQSALPPALIDQEMELAALTYAERKKKISRDKRYERYEHVLALHRAGVGQRAVARELHMSRRTVQRFLTSEGFPERAVGTGLRPRGKSKLDPYLEYLRARWSAGEHGGSRLFGEIKLRGYTGSASFRRLDKETHWCSSRRAFGYAARAVRAVSAGTGKIACGSSDIGVLLLAFPDRFVLLFLTSFFLYRQVHRSSPVVSKVCVNRPDRGERGQCFSQSPLPSPRPLSSFLLGLPASDSAYAGNGRCAGRSSCQFTARSVGGKDIMFRHKYSTSPYQLSGCF